MMPAQALGAPKQRIEPPGRSASPDSLLARTDEVIE
jgi:hypothetical protein